MKGAWLPFIPGFQQIIRFLIILSLRHYYQITCTLRNSMSRCVDKVAVSRKSNNYKNTLDLVRYCTFIINSEIKKNSITYLLRDR